MAKKFPDYHFVEKAELPVPENMTRSPLYNLILGDGAKFNTSTVCVENDFLSVHVFRPAVQATFRKFLGVCAPDVNAIFPDTWTLCTDDGQFRCDAISDYANACKHIHFDGDIGTTPKATTPEPCTMGHVMQDDKSAILLLVGLVFIGILLGVAMTVAVCLICPGAHRWAMNKIKGDKEEKVVRASTVSSEYYAAIDENNTATAVRLRPVQKLPSPLPSPDSQLQESKISPQASPVGDRDFNDPMYQDNGISGEPIYTETSGAVCYEHLSRNNPQGQSHKYAQIGPQKQEQFGSPNNTRQESEETEPHNYFTLEQTALKAN